MGRPDPARGDPECPRHPRAIRQGALCRVLELLGLAPHEGAWRLRAHRPAAFVSHQIYYSLQNRDIEAELVPASIDQNVGILVWSPIAGGLLSGKYRRSGAEGAEGSRHLSGDWNEPPIYDQEKLYDTIELLVEIGAARGVSAAQIALAWLIAKPAVTSVIVGARTEAQLSDDLASAELKLTEDEMKRLDDVSADPLRYPYWHQAGNSSDRLSPADLSLLAHHI